MGEMNSNSDHASYQCSQAIYSYVLLVFCVRFQSLKFRKRKQRYFSCIDSKYSEAHILCNHNFCSEKGAGSLRGWRAEEQDHSGRNSQ